MNRIILTHIRNDIPPYIEYTFKQYSITNPNIEIDFLCHKNLISDRNLNVLKNYNLNIVDVDDYKNDKLLNDFLERCYLNKNIPYAPRTTYPSQRYFWQAGIERLFFILAHMKEKKYDDIFHFENDNLIYDSVNSINKEELSKQYITVSKMSDICSVCSALYIPNIESLENICNKINELFLISEKELLSTYQCEMIHEMTILSMCAKYGLVSHFDSVPPTKQDFLFDALGFGQYICGTNNFQDIGYYTTKFNNIIGHKIKNSEILPYFDYEQKRPMIKFKDGSIYKIFNLHVHNKNLKPYISL